MQTRKILNFIFGFDRKWSPYSEEKTDDFEDKMKERKWLKNRVKIEQFAKSIISGGQNCPVFDKNIG